MPAIRSRTTAMLCLVLSALQVLLPAIGSALPNGGQVAGGQATISQPTSQSMHIQQTTDKAIINWQQFSIGAGEAVRFSQPSIHSITLNRVVGIDPSVILGQLQANGRIFLVNPNGILFGAGAQINVGGLLATTLQIRDEDFMAGRYLFAQDPLKSLGTVINRGTIHVSDHGFVVLTAPGVANEGVIVANLGTTVLGSGRKLTLDLMGDGLITYAISDKVLSQVTGPDGKPLSSAVSNSGTIQADGGQVILQAKASGDVFSSVVNQSGIIRARSLEQHGGVVKLIGGDDTLVAATSAGAMRPAGEVSGAVVNTGAIDVSAGSPNAAQGSVTMAGERVGQFGSITATGADGATGGEVILSSTTRTLLAGGSTIDVSGIGHSSAGRLRVWSDQDTFFNTGSTILARGGELGGNGGFIELSGRDNLGYAGTVNALAPFGSAGTLLLDPRNITVAAAGAAYNPGVNNLFANTPAADVTLSAASINAAAANVVLQANNDITVGSAINMANVGVGLTMQAGRDINVNAAITTSNGNISLIANDSTSILANRANGTAGDIIFAAGANLSSGTGNISLTVDPATAGNYAPGSITTVRNLTTTTGNIVLNSPNTISLSGAVNTGSGTVTMSANTDGAGAQAFTMNAGSSITAANNVAITVNAAGGGTGAATLQNLNAGPGSLTVMTNPGGNTVGGGITQAAGTSITANGGAQLTTGNGNISLRNVTTNANLLVSSRNAVTLNGAVNAGSGTVSIITNSDGAGTQNFAMNAGSSIATTNTSANAVQVIVNTPAGGTGAASLRGSITTGNGGTVTVSTRGQAAAGGNTTGGAITQGAALTMNTGAVGTIALATGSATANITLNNAANDFTGAVGVSRAFNVALRDANALALGASTISGTLGITTAGAVTQTGALTVTGTTTLAAGAANNITLNNAGNNFSTVGITNGNNVALTDANALVLAASTISGTVNVATNGALTQSGVLNVTGATTLAAGVGNNINLATSANNFSTVGITSGNNVSLRDTNALVLAASTVSGNLALTTGSALTQSGALNIAGTTSLTATAANTDILLGTQANNFGGTLSFAGTLSRFRDVSIRNVNAGATVPTLNTLTSLRNLTLQFDNAPVILPALTLTAGGSLNVTAGGVITDSGTLIIPGTTTLAAGSNNITLNNANNFTGAVSVTSGNNVTLNDSNALVLGPSTVSGTLNVATAGAVTQTGPLSVTGNTTVAAGAANNITLNNVANNFSTVGITSGNNVALTDASALDLAASTISGTLNVTTNGALSQSGALNVTGATTLAAGAANNIILNSAANNFSTVGITSGNNVSLLDTNALILGTSTVSGAFDVTTNGALTQSGALTVTGTTTLAAGAANSITLANVGNNFSTVGVTSGNTVTVVDANALDLGASTVSGNLLLTTGGALTQSGALAVTGTTQFSATAVNTDILLGTQANNFGGALSFVGTQSNFRDVQLRNVNAGATVPALAGLTNLRNLTLTFENAPMVLPALTASGNLTATAGGVISQAGALTVGGSASFDTTAAATLGSVTLANGNALTLNTSTVGGNLTASTAAGDITLPAGQTLTVVGDATLHAAGSANLLGTTRIGGAQTSTGSTGSTFVLSADTNLNALPLPGTGSITVNTTGTTATFAGGPILPTAINLNNVGNNFGGPVSVTTAAPAFTGTTTNTYNLTQSAPVNLTLGQSLTVTDLGGTAGTRGNIALTNAANSFETVDFTGGNIAWAETGPVTIGNLSASAGATSTGSLSITATGPITQTGAITVTGSTTLAAGAANDITLTNAGNNFTTVGITSGNNVTLNDSNALDLGASTVSGTLSVTTNGALTQSGALTVAGVTTLTAGAGNDITLSNPVNDFSTVGITSGNNVALTDANALNLAPSTVSGTLNVTTNGALTQSGALTVAGATTLASGGANNITLNNAGNDFSTVGISSGNNVALTSANALDLAASTVSGALGLTTGGTLTQSGALNVTGATSLTATAGNTDVLLSTQANNFGGSLSFAGTQSNFRDIQLRNVNAGASVPVVAGLTNLRNLTLQFDNAPITLPGLTAGGNLDITAGGSITQAGALVVGGTTTLATTVAGSDILLNAQANDFAGAVTFGGTQSNIRDVGLRNVNAGATVPALAGLTNLRNLTLMFDNAPVSLPGLTLNGGGNLDITAGGSITQTGVLTIPGTTTLATTVAGSDILLDTQANDFGGAVSFGGTQANIRDLGLRNVNAGATVPALAGLTNLRNLTLAFDNAPVTLPALTLTAGGNLSVTAGGAITDSGNVVVPGTTTLTAGANNIALDNANDFTGSVSIAGGNNVTLNDSNALDLGASIISGTLNVTTNGALTQSGPLTVAGATTLAAGAGNDITLNNPANNFSSVGITSGNNATLQDSNALGLGALTLSGTLSLAANGSITDANGAANNITATTANLTGASVGTAGDPIETSLGTLNATTTTGGIFVTQANAVTLGNVVAGGGDITITNAAGDMTINTVTATTGAVNLTAAGGSILDGNGPANNVTATANSTLSALGGVIGVAADPIEVNINGGSLGVAATNQVGGISATLNGTVLPSISLLILNSPPGLVLFNGIALNTPPTPLNLALLTGTAVYLNPDSIVPTYYLKPSRATLLTTVASTYVPGAIVMPADVLIQGDSRSVTRTIPSCTPKSGCLSGKIGTRGPLKPSR